MKIVMNRDREYLNCINNMIVDKNFELARKKIDNLKKNNYYKDYDFEIKYLSRFLEEQEKFYGEKKELVTNFLSSGRDCLYFDEQEEAYNYFSAGLYVTELPLFEYLMGKTLYMDYDTREQGVDLLEQYVNSYGGSKLYKACSILEEYYHFLDSKKSNYYKDKRDRIKLISNVDYKRNDRSVVFEEIKKVQELGKNKEIDKLYEMFDDSTDEIKLRIIGELYKRAYRKQADELYKKNRREIEKHSKNSKRLVNELDKNKTLFINKGKHDING